MARGRPSVSSSAAISPTATARTHKNNDIYTRKEAVDLDVEVVSLPVTNTTSRSSASSSPHSPLALSRNSHTSNNLHHQHSPTHVPPKPTPKVAEGYRNRLSMVVGTLRKAASTPSKASSQRQEIDQEEYDAETRAMQQEAMRLTWQAHAEVITTAAMNGEHPSMQNFMRAPQQSADKCWVVLKHGNLFVYPNNSKRDKDIAMDALEPLKEICLYGCSCRPMEQTNGFEIGVVKLTTMETLSQIELSRLEVQRWVPFYTEFEEQCRVWIMAIQFSATMHRYVDK